MRIANRVNQIGKSAIHEMTRLSKEVDDVAFLSWAKPTSDTPQHIKEAAVKAILDGLTGGYSENSGLPQLREEIAEKLNRDNHVNANAGQIIVTVGAIENLAAATYLIQKQGLANLKIAAPAYNENYDLSDDVTRVNNWKEIYDYVG